MAYNSETNGIAECTNSFIVFKDKCLFFNAFSKINQLFWPEIFIIVINLLNCSLLSFF